MSRKFPNDLTNNNPRESGEYFEEMSGMVTLKRKPKEDQNRTVNDSSILSDPALKNLF